MIHTRLSLLLVALLAFLSAPAVAQQIIPVPPDFELIRELPGEDPYSITKPTFSRDTKYIAGFMHSPRVLKVWDASNGEVLAEIPEDVHKLDGVDGLEFTRDGEQLIVLRNYRPMMFIDWKAGKVVREIKMDADPKSIMSYDFSDDQSLCVLGCYSKGLQVWDVKNGKLFKHFLKDQAISGVDLIIYQTKQGQTVRKIGYGRALLPPNTKFENVAGIIDLDSGAITTVLKDVPADKKPPEGSMTFLLANWQWGGGYLLISYMQIPPKINAGIFQVDGTTGKYVGVHELAQKTIAFIPKYLWKPYYGLSISSADLSNPMAPIKTATEFIIFTKEGLKTIDVFDESKLAVQSLQYNSDNTRAIITIKKTMQDTVKIYLYKVTPKKK